MKPALLLLLAVGLAAPQVANLADGLWEGVLNAGPVPLRLVLHLNGSQGKIDSIDQGANGLPVDSVSLQNGEVSLKMAVLRASYTGKLSADGKEMTGVFTQGATYPLTFRRIDAAPDTSRPQDPHTPYPYLEEEVSVPNAKAGVTLAGTLTRPKGKGPFPAAVLITGSGPQDRNEALMNHRPFLVIADRLTRAGIAVLRVDDRGVGKSTGTFSTATTADFAGDTLACFEFLKTREEIDHAHTGLVGHSEGGVIAPMVAAQASDVAFIVMMAGTAVPGREVLLEQQRLLARAMGVPAETAERGRKVNERIYSILEEDIDSAAAKKKIDALYEEIVAAMPEDERKALSPQMKAQMQQSVSPWVRYFLKYDPRPTLRKLRCPVLAMNGELDLQVSAAQNLPALAKALEEGGATDYEIVKLAKLNHLFQHASTGTPSEYAAITETVSPEVLDLMTAWIVRHTR